MSASQHSAVTVPKRSRHPQARPAIARPRWAAVAGRLGLFLIRFVRRRSTAAATCFAFASLIAIDGLPAIASDSSGSGDNKVWLQDFTDPTDWPTVKAKMTAAGSNVVLNVGGGQSLTYRNRTVTRTQTAASMVPGCRTRMTPRFADEFDTFVSSPTGIMGWKTQGGVDWRTLSGNNELEYYSDSSVGVNPFTNADGVLTITAAPGSNPLGLPYNSGIITTGQLFNFEYGLVEVSARLPAGAGLWPAIWLLPSNLDWPPEIDIMEMLGDRPNVIYASIHTADRNLVPVAPVGVGDTTRSFHTYGLDWEPDTITWCFDGNPIRTVATPADLHQPMYLLINLAVGGRDSWPGRPNRATQFPARMSLDYVRIYASPASTAISGTAVLSAGTSGGSVRPDSIPATTEPRTAWRPQ
jgi:beta-glucanase (GH16 family)